MREQLTALRAAEKALKAQINTIVTTCDLDPEPMAARIASAMENKHGRVIGLINLLTAVAYWPADKNEAKSAPANKLAITDKVDTLVLSMIKDVRGFHSFVTPELEIITGEEPDYDKYSELATILLEDLLPDQAIPTIAIDKAIWLAEESKAATKALQSQQDMLEAIEKYKAYLRGFGLNIK